MKNDIFRDRNHRIKVALLKVSAKISEICQTNNKIAPPDYQCIQYGGGAYFEVGLHFFRILLDHCELKRDSHVLDVGCGIGRMAMPLTAYLGPNGRYEGFDVMPDGIEYCARHITPQFPIFNFQLANVYNSFYHPRGEVKVEDYTMPYADASFDVVFSTSVFTHLPPSGVERYIRETARVLKPGGKCLHTCFVLDHESLAGIRDGRAAGGIKHQMDGFMTSSLSHVEDAIAIPEASFLRMYVEAGLGTPELFRGSWSGRKGPTLTYQDVHVATKPSRSR